MKRLMLCGAIALSLVGVMLVAYRDNRSSEIVVSNENNYSGERRYHRGPVRATVDGATDAARGTGHAIGHGIKNAFGAGHHHHGFHDSRGDYHE